MSNPKTRPQPTPRALARQLAVALRVMERRRVLLALLAK